MGKCVAYWVASCVGFIGGAWVTIKVLNEYVDWDRKEADDKLKELRRKEAREFVKNMRTATL